MYSIYLFITSRTYSGLYVCHILYVVYVLYIHFTFESWPTDRASRRQGVLSNLADGYCRCRWDSEVGEEAKQLTY